MAEIISSDIDELVKLTNTLAIKDTKKHSKPVDTPEDIKLKNILYYKIDISKDDIYALLIANNIIPHKKEDVDKDIDEEIIPFLEKISLLSLNNDDKFIIYNDRIYLLNNEFHITIFYNGGQKLSKPDKDGKTNLDKCNEFDQFTSIDKINVILEKISISPDFITIRVNSCGDIPYYGNPIKHITIAIDKTPDTSVTPHIFKKLKPVDSPSAFEASDRIDIDFDIDTYIIGRIKTVNRS